MQQQPLKACGDLKSTTRSSLSHRRSVPKKISNGGGLGNACLATDVTTLDINTMFQSKKSKRNGGNGHGPATAPPSPFQYLSGAQATSFTFPSYLTSAALYTNMDLMSAAAGELPPLMSVPAYKPSSLLHGFGDTSATMDFNQFTEELNALQNSSFPTVGSSPASLQSLFSSDGSSAAFLSTLPKSSSTSSSRNAGGRKNRMVEVRTINDQSVVVVSDPQAATASSRSTVVPLSRQVLGLPKALEESKKKPISAEPLFSRKVFIGGLPIDVTEEEVWTTFGSFGKVLVDWPRRPEHGARADMYDMDMGRRNTRSVSGYVFLVFQNEQSVQELVNACELYDNKYYLQLSSPTMADKAVQVRAWKLSDIDYFCDENSSVDHRRTVFIGGVPRPTRASDLARCLQEHYGKVSYVGIDIDPELKYPKGAARVTFATSMSFIRAISGRFVQVTHADTNKRVEIKPYVMEDQHCDECQGKLCKHNYAPYFCGDSSCLQYYCEGCWDRMHYEMCQTRADHRPMVRTGDQTRILPRPPHHPSSHYHHRQHQNHQSSSSLDHHHHHHSHHHHPSQSVISRIVNRSNNSAVQASTKPFAAIPTTIGF